MKIKTIRIKFVLAFSIIIVLNTVVSIYYTSWIRTMMNFNQEAQEYYYQINGLAKAVRDLDILVDLYMQNQEQVDILRYETERDSLKARLSIFKNSRDSADEWYMIHAMRNSVESMCLEYDQALSSIESSGIGLGAYLNYYQGKKISKYIPGYINEYMNIIVSENAKEGTLLAEKAEKVDWMTKFLLGLSAVLGLFFSGFFTTIITRPLRHLSEAARRISSGDFNIEDVPVLCEDEIGILTRAFNEMKNAVHKDIETLREKEELSARFHEEELKNIHMEKLLKEAQYLALQSQINPHFLFNTLNVISRAVVYEDAKVTTTLIRNLADLFRYNLNHLDNFTTLEEELNIVDKYIYIQKYRFRERIRYRVTGRTDCQDAQVPSMILQPLVENSIIHGIESLEYGGNICVNLALRGGLLCIRVCDNGVGIEKDILERIQRGDIMEHTGHTTAIGLSNIIKRVKLIPEGKVCIMSSGRRGTIVQILIPLKRNGGADV